MELLGIAAVFILLALVAAVPLMVLLRAGTDAEHAHSRQVDPPLRTERPPVRLT
ncbi:MAG: hypothetical protein ACRDRL_31895 [Sciscionella sp.]